LTKGKSDIDDILYEKIVNSLMFVMICTCHDIFKFILKLDNRLKVFM